YSSGPTRCLPAFPTRRSSDLEADLAAENMLAEEAAVGCFGDRASQRLGGEPVLVAQEDVRDVRADRVRGEDHAFDQLMRIAFERSQEHTSELQSRENLVCRLL